jgi:hypothetical protein
MAITVDSIQLDATLLYEACIAYRRALLQHKNNCTVEVVLKAINAELNSATTQMQRLESIKNQTTKPSHLIFKTEY